MRKHFKNFLGEFKTFVLRGNVMDLAVAVIIGAAFQTIINSLVNDVISPFIGIFAKMDFSYLSFEINGVAIKYGSFLTAIINFLIMTFIIFIIIRLLNRLMSIGKKEKEAETKKCIYCKTEIDASAVRCPHCTSVLDEKEEKRVHDEEKAKAEAEALREAEEKQQQTQQIKDFINKVNPAAQFMRNKDNNSSSNKEQ